MPTRVVREGILDSERVGALSPLAELFYRKLMSVVDDYGRFELVLSVLRARLYSQRLDDVSEDDIRKWINECCAGERPLLVCYVVNGKKYFEIQEFNQQHKSQKSKYPDPPSPDSVHARTRIPTEIHSRASSSSSTPSTSPHSSVEEGSGEKPTVVEISRVSRTSQRFEEWWALWSRMRGTNHQIQAAQQWVSTVTTDNEDALFACTKSYLASVDGPKGYNPEKFISEQSIDGYQARFPARSRGQPTKTAQAMEKFAQRELRERSERGIEYPGFDNGGRP